MPSELDSIIKLEVPVIVRLGERKMKLREILQFAPGAIIDLQKSADDPLELLANNRLIGGGNAVKVAENFGLRIDWIGDPTDRVQAMGPSTQTDDDDDDTIAMNLLAGPL